MKRHLVLALSALLCTGAFQALAAAGTRGPTTLAEPRSVTVYVTKTGKKYHRGDCQHLRRSKIAMSLADARKLYAPCSVCNPPE